MVSRNTKQKEIILDILEHHRTHPTIQEIYSYAKEKYPSIGQATIYRNVNKLVEEGKVLRLPSSNGESYHHDINTHQHNHLLCKNCGKIIDLFDNDYEALIKKVENKNSIKIERVTILIEGLCENCNN